MRRSTIISLICAAGLGGIIAGRAGIAGSGLMVLAATGIVVVTLRTRFAILTIMILALMLGLWRSTMYLHDQTHLTGLIGQKVSFTGYIDDDPGANPKGYQEFKLGHITAEGRSIPGEVTVRIYQTTLQRGYRLQLDGKLQDGFGNVPAELFYPQMTVLSTHQDALEKLRQRFFAGMRTALPEPDASFGLGLLVGVRGLIPKDLQTELSLVGLSHLVAVSGYNLTIMVAAAHRLLERFGRGIALAASLWLIGGFLLVTGASASIVRASLVAVLSLLAAFYGRRFNPVTLILLAAVVTAAFKPLYLTDLGWLLSFLAFFGILVLAPAVEARLGHPKLVIVRLFIESFTAQVMTIPLIMYIFGQFSVVAPITNLLVLPLVPLAMLVSFIAGLAGMLLPAFCGWLAWPAAWVLKFMLAVVTWFSHQKWAGTNDRITLPMMIAMYTALVALILGLKRSNTKAGKVEETHTLLEPVKPAITTH